MVPETVEFTVATTIYLFMCFYAVKVLTKYTLKQVERYCTAYRLCAVGIGSSIGGVCIN